MSSPSKGFAVAPFGQRQRQYPLKDVPRHHQGRQQPFSLAPPLGKRRDDADNRQRRPAPACPVIDLAPEATGQLLVRLARAALQTELAGADDLRRQLAALPAGPEMERLQGVFVTLNRKRPQDIAVSGKLRGCVGKIFPVYPLYVATVTAAVDAALHDGRFIPVHMIELPNLELEVTVLSPPKPVAGWRDIKLGTHGIVLEKDSRKAVLLPQVPGEQGWTIEQTLTALAHKAGLAPDA